MLEDVEHPLQFSSLAREIKRGWASIPTSGGESSTRPSIRSSPKRVFNRADHYKIGKIWVLSSRFRHFAQMFVHAIGDFSLVTDSVEIRAWIPPLPVSSDSPRSE